MTYGLISDIHANLEAFEVVLGELKGVEAFICLGDIVGYGPSPAGCIRRLRELPGLTCIVGNHDLAAIGRYDISWFNPHARQAIEWTAEQLSQEDRDFLGSLEERKEIGGAAIVHGSWVETMGYVGDAHEAMDSFRAMPGDLSFIGHTHVAEYYANRRATEFCEQVSLWAGGAISLAGELRYLVNPGAVGQPRDGNPAASFGLYDADARAVEVRRVRYEVTAVQEKMRAAGLPEFLIARLEVGR
jgi:diadenosine tetraphosphatase ApaH/serine/threonine PP2A family protein phosphatase